MDSFERAALRDLAHRLGAAERAVVFTGAGISTESGIPDFRSPGGVWSRHRPVDYRDFLASAEARRRYWAMRRESYPAIAASRPNPAHRAIADLEREGRLRAVITQNIDGLHQQAGSKRVLELHGNTRTVLCLSCGRRSPAEEIQARLEAGEEEPLCRECGGWLKAATVSFGQSLPADVLSEAEQLAAESDLFLAIGSSLVVYPAAALPQVAYGKGAAVVIINREETPLDSLACKVIRTPIGAALEEIYRLFNLYRDGIA